MPSLIEYQPKDLVRILKKDEIKSEDFFNNKQTAPLINQPAHLFVLLEKSSGFDVSQKLEKDSLKDYTLENAKPLTTKKR